MEQTFLTLSSGYKCPVLGLGTYRMNEESVIFRALHCAVKTGYRHVDTAFIYQNEAGIGRALSQLFSDKVVTREEMFVTTKLFGTYHSRERVSELLRKQLKMLGLDYVDLYLIHSPLAMKYHEEAAFPKDENGNIIFDLETPLEETWLGMEDCVKLKLAHSIGLSNFNESQLDRIIRIASVKPAVMQIESQPYFQNTKLINYCKSNDIAVTCFFPLGSNKKTRLLDDPMLIEIGSKYGKTAAHVCLRWQIQRGNAAIPKSQTPSHIVENYNIWDFELSDEDMAQIEKIDTNKRAFKADFPGAVNFPEFPFTELLKN